MDTVIGTSAAPDLIVAQLVEWVRGRKLWQQQAFRHVVGQPEMTDTQREEVLDLLLVESGLQPTKSRLSPVPVTTAELEGRAGPASIPRLVRLFALSNVNALPAHTELGFLPDGLTIVYGKNGVGKSSYVRSLKRLCRTVDRDTTILPNVLVKGAVSGKPCASIEWLSSDGTDPTSAQFDLGESGLDSPITPMSVFDVQCAQIYTDQENQLAFVPSSIQVLVRLADEQALLQVEVEGRIDAIRATRPDTSGFVLGTTVRAALDALTATSKYESLRQLATLDKTETTRRMELELALAAEVSGASAQQRGRLLGDAEGARDLIKKLQAAADIVSQERLDQLREAVTHAQRCREVAQLAADAAFRNETHLGVGSEPWRDLWEAARRFHDHGSTLDLMPGHAFPDTGDDADCPLCLQDLSSTAKTRFRHFEEFVKSDAEEHARIAGAAVTELLATFTDAALTQCRTPFLAVVKESDAKLHTAIEKRLVNVGVRLAQTIAAVSGDGEWPSGVIKADPVPRLEVLALKREQAAATITAAAKPEERLKLQSELENLKAREALRARLAEMRQWLVKLRELAALESAKSALGTHGITTKQKALTETVVTASLRDQLRRELDELGFTHIAIALSAKGKRGTTVIQLRLAEAPNQELASILSEGERRALALAFFFAEIAIMPTKHGVILDDPVSSLDHERRSQVAKRIAFEATQRQVILFTHEIAFLLHVEAEAAQTNREPMIQQIWRAGDTVGMTAAGTPFDASKVTIRIGSLKKQLQEMPKPESFSAPDEERGHIRFWYEQLRSSWERAIEEIVFNNTIQRFVPDVQTSRLKDVRVTDEMLKAVDDGMTRCSKWLHDQPAAQGGVQPTRADMWDDIAALEGFCKTFRP